MDREDSIGLRWIADESDAERVRQAIEDGGSVASVEPWEPDADGAEEFGDSQFEPLMLIGGTVAIGWLVKQVSDVLLDWQRPGGLLIDTTGDEVVVRPTPRAPRASLVLVSATGAEVVLPEKREAALAALPGILAAMHG